VEKTTDLVVHPKQKGPYLFNIFINYIINYTDTEETHSPVIRELKIPGLLLADDLAVASFTSYRLQ
jgi:hypothetical protein